MTSFQHRVMELLQESVLGKYLESIQVRVVSERRIEITVPQSVVKNLTGVEGANIEIDVRRVNSSSTTRVLGISVRVLGKCGGIKSANWYLSGYKNLPESINTAVQHARDEIVVKTLGLQMEGERLGFESRSCKEIRRVMSDGSVLSAKLVKLPTTFPRRPKIYVVLEMEFESKLRMPVEALEKLVTAYFRDRYSGRVEPYCLVHREKADDGYEYVVKVEATIDKDAPSVLLDLHRRIREYEETALRNREVEMPEKELGLLASVILAVMGDEDFVPPELRDRLYSLFRETGRDIREILTEAEERLRAHSSAGLVDRIGAEIDPETLSVTLNGKPAAEILWKYFGKDTEAFLRKLAREYYVEKYGGAENPFKEMERDGVLTSRTASLIATRLNLPLSVLAEVWDMLDEEAREKVLRRKTAYELYTLCKTAPSLCYEKILR